MWIYTQNGFYSIVEDRDDPDRLLVRARVKGDIERLWPKSKVTEDAGSDYAFRARLSRNAVQKVLVSEIKAIDYDNFKQRIGDKDPEREHWYHKVWSMMTAMQSFLKPRRKR